LAANAPPQSHDTPGSRKSQIGNPNPPHTTFLDSTLSIAGVNNRGSVVLRQNVWTVENRNCGDVLVARSQIERLQLGYRKRQEAA